MWIHIKTITAVLLALSITLSAAGCIKIVPKSTTPSEQSDPASPDTGDDSDWILNDDNMESQGTGNEEFDMPDIDKNGSTTYTNSGSTTTACDLTIQPANLNSAPGIYTFTASAPSHSNAEYIWDINGIVQQYGPQNTFSANLNTAGTGIVSVTLVVDGVEICTAASPVTITGSQAVKCDLSIYPETLNNVIGTYTFTASTSYSNALFIWDINGSPQQYGPQNTFSVNFNGPGTGTISVTMVIDGNEVCTATSFVTISAIIIK